MQGTHATGLPKRRREADCQAVLASEVGTRVGADAIGSARWWTCGTIAADGTGWHTPVPFRRGPTLSALDRRAVGYKLAAGMTHFSMNWVSYLRFAYLQG